jgi:cytidine deaminase
LPQPRNIRLVGAENDLSKQIAANEAALIGAAQQVMAKAYAKYSHFSVGAALRTQAGKIYVGCNVENISYPVGVCAERNAIAAAVAAEGPEMRIETLALTARYKGKLRPCSPCGACRQAIAEFGRDAKVVFRDEGSNFCCDSIAYLLPKHFSFAEDVQE